MRGERPQFRDLVQEETLSGHLHPTGRDTGRQRGLDQRPERILWEQALKSRGQSTLQNNTEDTRHLQAKIKWLQVTVHIACACTFL